MLDAYSRAGEKLIKPSCLFTFQPSPSPISEIVLAILGFRETTSRHVPTPRSGTDFSSADSAGKDHARLQGSTDGIALPSTSDIRPAIVIARQGIENASDIFFSPRHRVRRAISLRSFSIRSKRKRGAAGTADLLLNSLEMQLPAQRAPPQMRVIMNV